MKRFGIVIVVMACIVGCTSNTVPVPKMIDLAKDGTYERDGWKYVFDLKEIEGKNDGWWGYLYRDGNHLGDLSDLAVGRKIQTQWGPMYWVGVPQMVTGYHGWLPLTLARDAWSSRQKPKHWENVEDFQQPLPQVQK